MRAGYLIVWLRKSRPPSNNGCIAFADTHSLTLLAGVVPAAARRKRQSEAYNNMARDSIRNGSYFYLLGDLRQSSTHCRNSFPAPSPAQPHRLVYRCPGSHVARSPSRLAPAPSLRCCHDDLGTDLSQAPRNRGTLNAQPTCHPPSPVRTIPQKDKEKCNGVPVGSVEQFETADLDFSSFSQAPGI